LNALREVASEGGAAGFTAAWFLASLVVGSVGLGLVVYGKKQLRFPHLIAGVALLFESLVVQSWGWMLAFAAGTLCALWVALWRGA
jgi:hypothetical protein